MKPICFFFCSCSILISLLCCACLSSKVQMAEMPAVQKEQANPPADTIIAVAKIEFDSSSYDFGTIRQGEVLEKVIYFTNSGQADLKIELITACECTTLDYTRLPVKPGQRSSIKIKYNSKDKSGPQTVDLDILANTSTGFSYTKFKLLVEK